MITLQTVILEDRVEYSVARADEVLWTRTEFFGRDAAHRVGGYAFQAATAEQNRQAALAMGADERVEVIERRDGLVTGRGEA